MEKINSVCVCLLGIILILGNRLYAETEIAAEKKETPKAPALVETNFVYKGDYWQGLSGNFKSGAYLGNIDLRFTFHGEAYRIPGNTIFIYFLNNHGDKPIIDCFPRNGLIT